MSNEHNTAIVSKSTGRLLPVPSLSTIAGSIIIIFLIYAFFSGLTMQFYASFLFLFYSVTKRMWVSVILLGVFQTLLMIPFRIINMMKAPRLDAFKETAEQIASERDQQFLKKQFRRGGRVAVYYLVNFCFSLVSYTSLGRLFLTDFYTQPIDPKWLYSWVPYPDYPILDRIFKIPYAWFTSTRDLGAGTVWWVWGIILVILLVIYIGVYLGKKRNTMTPEFSKKISRYTTGNLILFLVLSWILVRHFPAGWEFRIFTGDVGVPNRTLNGITAIVTFLTLIWVNLPKIRIQIEAAEKAGVEQKVIDRTHKTLLLETIKVAGFVGLGAYFITNLIPSAFELSIFTLEIISLLSPLTLDKIILQGAKPADKAAATLTESTSAEDQTHTKKKTTEESMQS